MSKIILSLIFLFSFLISQDEQPYPPLNLVTIPTAGTLPKGHFTFENTFVDKGGILPKFAVGLTNSFTIGLSFGISNFIGTGEIKTNKSYPEVQVKYRIFDETETIPAMVLGIDTQGKGLYHKQHLHLPVNRYEQKSFGLYFVISRNWKAMGNFGMHVGINKNLNENDDHDDDINLFLGFDKELNRSFSFYAEYNFARDDNHHNDELDEIIYREGEGYINSGFRWAATNNLMLEINFNDIAKNNLNYNAINRELKVIYFEQF